MANSLEDTDPRSMLYMACSGLLNSLNTFNKTISTIHHSRDESHWTDDTAAQHSNRQHVCSAHFRAMGYIRHLYLFVTQACRTQQASKTAVNNFSDNSANLLTESISAADIFGMLSFIAELTMKSHLSDRGHSTSTLSICSTLFFCSLELS